MAEGDRIHERAILDLLETRSAEAVTATAWRVARKGRDPLRGAVANGRWNAVGEFEALYTSLAREGAIAEVGYRLSLEPVWPSRIAHEVHTLAVRTARTLRFSSREELQPFGVDISRYESFDYGATQAIAAAAHFLEFDGLIVPSARYECLNLVLFSDRLPALPRVKRSEALDWKAWRKGAKR